MVAVLLHFYFNCRCFYNLFIVKSSECFDMGLLINNELCYEMCLLVILSPLTVDFLHKFHTVAFSTLIFAKWWGICVFMKKKSSSKNSLFQNSKIWRFIPWKQEYFEIISPRTALFSSKSHKMLQFDSHNLLCAIEMEEPPKDLASTRHQAEAHCYTFHCVRCFWTALLWDGHCKALLVN